MAGVISRAAGPSGFGDLRCQRAAAQDQRLALAVLLTGSDNPRDPAVQQFLNFARTQSLSLDELWLAQQGHEPVAAALIVPCAGKSAMAFTSPAAGEKRLASASQVMRAACEAQDPRKVRLIQALIDPHQQRAAQSLTAAGFNDLAVLSYMQAKAQPQGKAMDMQAAGLEVYHWSQANRDYFARAILASYEDTLDCPGLVGKREIDDIIASHQAAGVFRPALWYALYQGDNPAGVMLLNEVPASDAWELVYLGLSVPFRGQGLAHKLLGHALHAVADQGASSLILAVDERNTPAVRLYRDAGFVVTGRKRALIFTLDEQSEKH